MMSLINVTRHLFWVILFVSFCIVRPRNLTSDNSCLCRPSNECMNDPPRLYKSSQVLILPCESEHLVRCCSVIPKPVESTRTDELTQNTDLEEEPVTESEPNEHLTETLMQLVENENESDKYDESSEKYSTTEWIPTESPLEKLSSDVTVPSQTAKVLTKDFSAANVNDVADKNNLHSIVAKNIISLMSARKNLPLKQLVPKQQQEQRYLNTRQLLKPQSIRIRILNNESTNASSAIRFPHPERHIRQPETEEEPDERMPEVSISEEEQDLIDQATSFESTKASKVSYPRERVAPEFKETKERTRKSVTGVKKLLFPRRTILDTDYRSSASFVFLSTPKSAPENTADYLKQKASLESSLTLDRVSTRATNENAKPQSKLSRLRDGVTSITNLSYPEGTKSGKRVV